MADSTFAATRHVDPFEFYADLQRVGGVRWDDVLNAWVVGDYATCAYVLTHDELFALPKSWNLEPSHLEKERRGRDVKNLSGQMHHKLHTTMEKLTQGHAQRSQPRTREIASTLIDRFAQLGKADLASQYANQLPLRVGMHMVGLDDSDERLVARLQSLYAPWRKYLETLDPKDLVPSTTALAEAKEIVMPEIRRRQHLAGDDLISDAWRAGPEVFADWDEDDVFQMVVAHYMGSATPYLLCNLIYMLAQDPSVQGHLEGDRDKYLPRFIEEGLRCLGVHHFLDREALRDTELRGKTIRRGDRLYVLISAANVDEQKYPGGKAVDMSVPARKNHLAFSRGPRYCAGNSLVRMIATEAVDVLIGRLCDLRLDPRERAPELADWRDRSYEPLHMVFAER